MSLIETGHSTGTTSLAGLLAGDLVRAPDPELAIPDLVERVAVGGWPSNTRLTPVQAIRANRDYLNEIVRVDVTRVAGPRRDPNRVLRLVQALARNVSTYATGSTLAADTGGAEGPLDRETVREYIEVLRRLFIVEDQPAWSPALRSRSILRSEAKRHLVDPSLAVSAMGGSPERLRRDMNTFDSCSRIVGHP